MSRISDFLTETGVFFMATADGDQPKLRPLGAFIELDGKLMFGIGDFKDVYKQLLKNPKVEIVACKQNGQWLRYTGKAVFESDRKYADTLLGQMPHLRDIYNEQTGNRMMMFHLEDASARIINVMGEGEKIL